MYSANPARSGSDLRIGAAVMASGTGSRFRANKLLMDFDGRPLFEWVLDALPTDLLTRVVVVTPYDKVAKGAAERGFDVVHNDAPRKGQAHTIRLAVDALSDMNAAMFCVADQPFMSPASVRRLLEERCNGITALHFNGRRGNPVVFPSEFFVDLATLRARETGSAVIRRHMDCLYYVQADCAVELMDIDVRKDCADLRGVKNFFLTGAMHVGKSTMLRRALEDNRIKATGVTTLPYTIEGQHAGHRLHALSSSISKDANDKPISVYVPPDSCIPIPQTFSMFGTQYLDAAAADEAPVVLLDELGRLETSAPDFQAGVLSLLDAPKPVIGILKDGDIPWLTEIRERPDTRVVRVLPEHRDEARSQVDRFLGAHVLA